MKCRLKENKNLDCIYLTKENVKDFLHTEYKDMFEQGLMTIEKKFEKYDDVVTVVKYKTSPRTHRELDKIEMFYHQRWYVKNRESFPYWTCYTEKEFHELYEEIE